jgi:hypothetical protein
MATLPGSVPIVVAFAMFSSVGTSLAFSAMPLLVMAGVPPTETAAANRVNSLVRIIGMSSCSAFIAAVTSAFTMDVGGRQVPSADAFTLAYGAAGAAAAVGAILALAQLWQSWREAPRGTVIVQPEAA